MTRPSALLVVVGLAAIAMACADKGGPSGDPSDAAFEGGSPKQPDAEDPPGYDGAVPPRDAAPPPEEDDAARFDAWARDADVKGDTALGEPDTGFPAPSDAGPRREPPPPPAYSMGECPPLVMGPSRDTSINMGFRTGEQRRTFRLLVPPSYDGSEPWPVVFAWHWLNATGSSFIKEGELDTAVEQMRFIAVLPDALENENGDNTYLLSWPFAEDWGAAQEILFFDDMLACVSNQLNVDPARVYGIGVSAGALWLTYLTSTERADYFASVEILSGGLGEVLGAWQMQYTAQPNKYPAIVLWGGMGDWLGLDFNAASLRLRAALVADNHFVVSCTHDAGHAVPPLVEPEGITRFRAMWQFMLDHPYGLPPGWSPYLETGLPEFFPDWCEIAQP